VSLSRKKLQEHCTSVNVTKKLRSADSVQGELGLGKGNSEKMCLQPAPEGAECLWRSDAGWQAVPDARSSDEESPDSGDSNRRTTRWRRYESRRWRRTQSFNTYGPTVVNSGCRPLIKSHRNLSTLDILVELANTQKRRPWWGR